MKKNIFKSLIFLFVFAVSPVYVAWGYNPLVNIPGLTPPVTISSYLVGIYNFMLSVVGIVAMLMIVIGGIRYITAAGNTSALAEAKDIIKNAIIGLLLALFSWVIVAAINPDLLYIDNPNLSNDANLYGCGVFRDLGSGIFECECLDGNITSTVPPTAAACSQQCGDEGHCIASAFSTNIECAKQAFSTDGECECLNGNTVEVNTGDCNQDCKDAKECGLGKFLYVKLHTRDSNSYDALNDIYNTSKADYVTISGNKVDRDHGPDELWDLYTSDKGTEGSFNVTAIDHTNSVTGNLCTCAILASNEDPDAIGPYLWGLDEVGVYWVEEGVIIGETNKNNLFESIKGKYEYCASYVFSSDCNIDIPGEPNSISDWVIKAEFTTNIVDMGGKLDFATPSYTGTAYQLESPLRCVEGSWQPF